MNRIVLALALFVACLTAALSSAAAQTPPMLIDGVTVVDVETGALREAQQILIREGRMAMAPAPEAIPEGVRRIDAAGKFAIPGLINAHVHFCAPEVFGPLALAHGVTFIRDLGGDPPTILAARDRLEKGELPGPQMMAVGPILDGDPPVWPFSIAIKTKEAAREAVQTVVEAGFDEIKVYSRLEEGPLREIIAAGHEHGLRVVGHIPDAVSLDEAVAWGLDESQHLMGIAAAAVVVAGKEEWAKEHHRAEYWQVWQTLTPRAKEAIIAPVAESAMAVTPTLVVYESIAKEPASLATSPWGKYMPAMLTGWWASAYSPERARNETLSMPGRLDAVQRLHARGVPVLAGSDLCNPNVIAGASLHRELELFTEAGLTPLEALRSATIMPARQLRRPDLGVIRDGAIASLVLLEANPLASLDALANIQGVAVAGRWYDRADLDRLLAALETTGGEGE